MLGYLVEQVDILQHKVRYALNRPKKFRTYVHLTGEYIGIVAYSAGDAVEFAMDTLGTTAEISYRDIIL